MFTVLKLILAPRGCCAVEFYTSGGKKNNNSQNTVKKMFLNVLLTLHFSL